MKMPLPWTTTALYKLYCKVLVNFTTYRRVELLYILETIKHLYYGVIKKSTKIIWILSQAVSVINASRLRKSQRQNLSKLWLCIAFALVTLIAVTTHNLQTLSKHRANKL